MNEYQIDNLAGLGIRELVVANQRGVPLAFVMEVIVKLMKNSLLP
jgi:hypothetical protein